jgi:hypothetical protein
LERITAVLRAIAAAQIGLFQHRDIGDAVVFGQVVGGGQAMAAAPMITTS